MKNIHKVTFKDTIKQYFINFYSRKPPPAPFPPAHRLFSLAIPHRVLNLGRGLNTHSSKRLTQKPPPSTQQCWAVQTGAFGF